MYREFDAYKKAEEKSNKFTIWFATVVMVVFTLGVILVSVVLSFVSLFYGNYDTSMWFIPFYYHNIFPFDTSTVAGWYFELFFQMGSGYSYVFAITSTISLFGGFNWYIEACYLQIKHMLNILDEMNDTNIDFQEIDAHFNRIIVFHTEILE